MADQLRLGYDHNDAACEVDELLRHAADKHFHHVFRAPLADDDGVCVLFFGEINDGLCDVAATGFEHNGTSARARSLADSRILADRVFSSSSNQALSVSLN